MDPVREPAVAGRFYPGQADELAREVRGHLPDATAEDAIGLVGPHAGYVYSGAIAGETYARVRVPRRAIVLGPNHTGLGPKMSVWPSGVWRLPGMDLGVDPELVRRLEDEVGFEPDQLAHLREHSVEVHLPFLAARRRDVSIAPACLRRLSADDCRKAGEGIAQVVRDTSDAVLLVASTDMSHFLDAETARRLDHLALDRVRALDPEGLHRTVEEHDISMCGYIPTTVMLFAALSLGATRAELVRYGNSGEAFGDYARVVGYAGLVIR